MRAAFVSALLEIADEDDRVVLLTGDLGFMLLEPFASRFPSRFFNMGVAEANMLGAAAGMAQQGLVPYCYSIATFASMRGYEQFRNGAVLHSLPVRVVGVGGGFGYGAAGPTHWALEDLGVMRIQPGVTVAAPGGDEQVAGVMRVIHGIPGPAYVRLGKTSASVPELAGRFSLGRLEVVATGGRIALVTTGGMTDETIRAAGLLQQRGESPTVVQVPCLAPAPLAALGDVAADHQVVITSEDHYRSGGLGSLVAEAIAESGASSRLIRLAVDGSFDGRSGDEAWMRHRHGLTAEAICAVAAAAVAGRSAA